MTCSGTVFSWLQGGHAHVMLGGGHTLLRAVAAQHLRVEQQVMRRQRVSEPRRSFLESRTGCPGPQVLQMPHTAEDGRNAKCSSITFRPQDHVDSSKTVVSRTEWDDDALRCQWGMEL